MLEFLFGKRGPEILPDKIWMTEKAKWGGLAEDARTTLASGRAVLIVSHFPETQTLLGKVLPEARKISGPLWPEPILSSQDPLSWPWHEWPSPPPETVAKRAGGLSVLFAEHFPLPGRPQELSGKLAGWSAVIDLRSYSSLEDPVIAAFGGDGRLKDMLVKLGMKEDEAIESQLVANSIAAAQKRIEKQAATRLPAPNALSWLRQNLPAS